MKHLTSLNFNSKNNRLMNRSLRIESKEVLIIISRFIGIKSNGSIDSISDILFNDIKCFKRLLLVFNRHLDDGIDDNNKCNGIAMSNSISIIIVVQVFIKYSLERSSNDLSLYSDICLFKDNNVADLSHILDLDEVLNDFVFTKNSKLSEVMRTRTFENKVQCVFDKVDSIINFSYASNLGVTNNIELCKDDIKIMQPT